MTYKSLPLEFFFIIFRFFCSIFNFENWFSKGSVIITFTTSHATSAVTAPFYLPNIPLLSSYPFQQSYLLLLSVHLFPTFPFPNSRLIPYIPLLSLDSLTYSLIFFSILLKPWFKIFPMTGTRSMASVSKSYSHLQIL